MYVETCNELEKYIFLSRESCVDTLKAPVCRMQRGLNRGWELGAERKLAWKVAWYLAKTGESVPFKISRLPTKTTSLSVLHPSRHRLSHLSLFVLPDATVISTNFHTRLLETHIYRRLRVTPRMLAGCQHEWRIFINMNFKLEINRDVEKMHKQKTRDLAKTGISMQVYARGMYVHTCYILTDIFKYFCCSLLKF